MAMSEYRSITINLETATTDSAQCRDFELNDYGTVNTILLTEAGTPTNDEAQCRSTLVDFTFPDTTTLQSVGIQGEAGANGILYGIAVPTTPNESEFITNYQLDFLGEGREFPLLEDYTFQSSVANNRRLRFIFGLHTLAEKLRYQIILNTNVEQ